MGGASDSHSPKSSAERLSRSGCEPLSAASPKSRGAEEEEDEFGLHIYNLIDQNDGSRHKFLMALNLFGKRRELRQISETDTGVNLNET